MAIDHTTPHPGGKHFTGIRGKAPAHHDHKQHGEKPEGHHYEGGPHGFSMADEGSVGTSGNETIPAPTEHGGSITVPPAHGL